MKLNVFNYEQKHSIIFPECFSNTFYVIEYTLSIIEGTRLIVCSQKIHVSTKIIELAFYFWEKKNIFHVSALISISLLYLSIQVTK